MHSKCGVRRSGPGVAALGWRRGRTNAFAFAPASQARLPDVTPRRPRWTPARYEQACADVAGGWVQESLHLDLKRDVYLRTDQRRKKAAQDMAAMSVYGGSILLGVEENGDTGLAERVTPVPLARLPEWISQIPTVRIGPALHVQTRVLGDPNDTSQGVIVIDVPVSPVACRCRKLHPCSSDSVLVFVEDAAESINSPDVEVVEPVRFGDRLAQLA